MVSVWIRLGFETVGFGVLPWVELHDLIPGFEWRIVFRGACLCQSGYFSPCHRIQSFFLSSVFLTSFLHSWLAFFCPWASTPHIVWLGSLKEQLHAMKKSGECLELQVPSSIPALGRIHVPGCTLSFFLSLQLYYEMWMLWICLFRFRYFESLGGASIPGGRPYA